MWQAYIFPFVGLKIGLHVRHEHKHKQYTQTQ